MLSRIAARLLTGPLAFLIAGVVDLVAFAIRIAPTALREEKRVNRGGPNVRS